MSQTILVVEKQRWHAPQLERDFANEELHVRLLPEFHRLPAVIEESSPCVLVLHLQDRFAEALQMIDRLRRDHGNVQTLVVVPAAAGSLEWMLRELSVTDVVWEPVPFGKLAATIRRMLGRLHV